MSQEIVRHTEGARASLDRFIELFQDFVDETECELAPGERLPSDIRAMVLELDEYLKSVARAELWEMSANSPRPLSVVGEREP